MNAAVYPPAEPIRPALGMVGRKFGRADRPLTVNTPALVIGDWAAHPTGKTHELVVIRFAGDVHVRRVGGLARADGLPAGRGFARVVPRTTACSAARCRVARRDADAGRRIPAQGQLGNVPCSAGGVPGRTGSRIDFGARVIAALYVQDGGCYFGLPNVDPWPESRDARKYAGPWPVVAHPPCARWSKLAGLVEARYGRKRGDDGGCFASALASVRTWGAY